MAYVYCKKCGWQQDDFWNKTYNPLRFFVTNVIPTYIMPHFYKSDFSGHIRWYFSWITLFKELWRVINPMRYIRQRWWTYNSWKKAVKRNGGKWPPCECGGSLCID